MEILEVGKEVLAEFLAQEWDAYDQEQFGSAGDVLWKEKALALAVYEGERIIGAAVFKTEGGVGQLRDLIVATDLRDQGVGSQLLARFEEICRGAGCRKVRLFTYFNSAAQVFYEKHGYAVEAVLRQDMLGRDWAIMAKFLNSR